MKNTLIVTLIGFSFLGCLTAPDYKRDNENDLSSGIPYIRDARYQIDRNGLIVNWIDGSIENDVFIITQKMYDQSGVNSDSLIKQTILEEDRTFFQDLSGEYGYPYSMIISSVIYGEGESVKTQFNDTLNVEFGELIYRSQIVVDDSLIFNWQNIPNPFVNEGVLVEINKGTGWEEITLLPYLARSFKYGLNNIDPQDTFRVSLTVRNFNGELSRSSGFEISPN